MLPWNSGRDNDMKGALMDVNLKLITKDGIEKDFRLPSTVTVIGRRQDCDLCIPLMNVSRRHCEINQDENKLKVRDLGSRNGTFVNGKKIEEAPLNDGDEIIIGHLGFQVAISEEEGNGQAKEISSEFLKEQGYYSQKGDSNETEVMDGFGQ